MKFPQKHFTIPNQSILRIKMNNSKNNLFTGKQVVFMCTTLKCRIFERVKIENFPIQYAKYFSRRSELSDTFDRVIF